MERALALVTPAPGTSFAAEAGQVVCTPPPSAGPAALVRFGADVHRLRAALRAEGVATVPDDAVPVTLSLTAATFAGRPGPPSSADTAA